MQTIKKGFLFADLIVALALLTVIVSAISFLQWRCMQEVKSAENRILAIDIAKSHIDKIQAGLLPPENSNDKIGDFNLEFQVIKIDRSIGFGFAEIRVSWKGYGITKSSVEFTTGMLL